MSFQQYAEIRKKRSFSQKMNEDMYNSITKIVFDSSEMQDYMRDHFSDGSDFTYEKAGFKKIKINSDFFRDFEQEYEIKQPYCFNEFQYFDNALLSERELNKFSGFYAADHLKEITFPSTWTKLPQKMFSADVDETFLDTVKFAKDSKLNEIGKECFSNSIALVNIVLPKTVTKIHQSAFFNCMSLEKINLEDTKIEFVAYNTFGYCIKLKKVIIPDTAKFLGTYAFNNCNKLVEIKLSKNITKIPSFCFSNCTSLKKIDIPEKVKEFETNAFADCTSLKEMHIHSKIVFQDDAFIRSDNIIFYIDSKFKKYYTNQNSLSGKLLSKIDSSRIVFC